MYKYDEFFIEELKKRKYIVTNSDIDGILSATLLCYFFPNLSLKGFTNSATNIWVTDDVNKDNSIYIDIYMTNDKTFTIDNHIINTKNTPINNNLKLNPNLIKGITLENYTNKFPFSTFIFILHILEKHFETNNIDLDKIIGFIDNEPIYLWELISRGDDILLNCYKYKKNTDAWWVWVLGNNNGILRQIYNKFNLIGTRERAEEVKNKVQKFLLKTFNLKTDGYKNINDVNFEKFTSFISKSLLNIELNKPDNLIDYNVNLIRHNIYNPNDYNLIKLQEDFNIISLAFVTHNTLSFSYI